MMQMVGNYVMFFFFFEKAYTQLFLILILVLHTLKLENIITKRLNEMLSKGVLSMSSPICSDQNFLVLYIIENNQLKCAQTKYVSRWNLFVLENKINVVFVKLACNELDPHSNMGPPIYITIYVYSIFQ